MYEQAKNEKPFTAKELTQEILPLMKDYFIAEFSQKDNEIIAKFPNGQTFRITAQLT